MFFISYQKNEKEARQDESEERKAFSVLNSQATN
jgi:hypothetical protein